MKYPIGSLVKWHMDMDDKGCQFWFDIVGYDSNMFSVIDREGSYLSESAITLTCELEIVLLGLEYG